MKTASLTIKDSEIEVVYGELFSGEDPREEAFGSLKYLYSDLTDIRKYYIRLGFHLEEFRRLGYYKDFGYLTLEDFCEKNLAMDKGAVSRCINVFLAFNASKDVTCSAGVKTVGCAMDLSEKWKDYSYTQLCELLPLSEDERNEVTPDMTVKDIREFKKQLKSRKTDSGAQDIPVASTQPENKKPFDYKRYESSRGIVRQNIVKNCTPVKENVVVDVFDRNGRFVYGNVACDLIHTGNGRYYFRLWQADDEA